MTRRATLSRRQFAQNLATAGAATVLAPVLMAQTSPPPSPTPPTPDQPATPPPSEAAKPVKRDAEVEARISWIDEKYGSRLDDTQRKDIRRLISDGQAGVLTMRAYPLDNGNQPSPVFRPYSGKGKKRS